MPLALGFGMLVVGLAALAAGGGGLVAGASGLARRLGVPPVLVGLTVVAFGTSMPELVVTVAATLRGSPAVGFGNVVGSNTANIGLLLGVAAILSPVAVHRTLVAREIPVLLLGCATAVVLGAIGARGGGAAGFGRGDGLVLLLLFGAFLHYTIRGALAGGAEHPPGSGEAGAAGASGSSSLRAWLLVASGLAALVAGGELAVRGATGLAESAGVPESIVGLTVVAVGTSLPELATTLTAARRGEGDLALGNIVGSNVFNLLFVWGLAVVVTPATLPPWGLADLVAMTAFALALLPIAISQRRIGRAEGAVLVFGYLSYVLWLGLR